MVEASKLKLCGMFFLQLLNQAPAAEQFQNGGCNFNDNSTAS